MKTVRNCERCGSIETEKKLHFEAMDQYHVLFAHRYDQLLVEELRLKALLRDVTWYHFKTVVRDWARPWPKSVGESPVLLRGVKVIQINKRGRTRETCTYPVYYGGSVSEAPPLPPTIIWNEITEIAEEIERARLQYLAPYEWAPGGRLYEQMLRESPGVQAFRETSSDVCVNYGPQLGDPMERPTEEDTETTASNLLGRVCGDRCVVCEGAGCRHT